MTFDDATKLLLVDKKAPHTGKEPQNAKEKDKCNQNLQHKVQTRKQQIQHQIKQNARDNHP